MSKLTHIFSSVLGIPEERVTPDLSPENAAAWDSLNAIILVTEIEAAFGAKFGFDEVMAVKSFADVISLMNSYGLNPDE